MSSMFLDPHKPLSTCSSSTCQGCSLQYLLQCHFGARQLLRFLGVAFPVFILGGIGIARVSAWLLLPWIGLALSYFGLVEIRVMCSHCPHYAEPGSRTLQCWANYGSPKLWKYRPGPMTRVENMVFFSGLFLLAGYPLAIMAVGHQWFFLPLFLATTAGMGLLMARTMCSRCMNFACPFNRVELNIRKAFFNRNPTIANAWKGDRS